METKLIAEEKVAQGVSDPRALFTVIGRGKALRFYCIFAPFYLIYWMLKFAIEAVILILTPFLKHEWFADKLHRGKLAWIVSGNRVVRTLGFFFCGLILNPLLIVGFGIVLCFSPLLFILGIIASIYCCFSGPQKVDEPRVKRGEKPFEPTTNDLNNFLTTSEIKKIEEIEEKDENIIQADQLNDGSSFDFSAVGLNDIAWDVNRLQKGHGSAENLCKALCNKFEHGYKELLKGKDTISKEETEKYKRYIIEITNLYSRFKNLVAEKELSDQFKDQLENLDQLNSQLITLRQQLNDAENQQPQPPDSNSPV